MKERRRTSSPAGPHFFYQVGSILQHQHLGCRSTRHLFIYGCWVLLLLLLRLTHILHLSFKLQVQLRFPLLQGRGAEMGGGSRVRVTLAGVCGRLTCWGSSSAARYSTTEPPVSTSTSVVIWDHRRWDALVSFMRSRTSPVWRRQEWSTTKTKTSVFHSSCLMASVLFSALRVRRDQHLSIFTRTPRPPAHIPVNNGHHLNPDSSSPWCFSRIHPVKTGQSEVDLQDRLQLLGC